MEACSGLVGRRAFAAACEEGAERAVVLSSPGRTDWTARCHRTALSNSNGPFYIQGTKQRSSVQVSVSLEAQVGQKKRLVDAHTADRAKLVSAGSEKKAHRHTEVAAAANAIRINLRRFTNQRQTFLALRDDVKDLRRNQAPEALRQMQARHSNSGMSDERGQRSFSITRARWTTISRAISNGWMARLPN